MKRILKKMAKKLRNGLVVTTKQKLEQQEERIRKSAADVHFRARAQFKRAQNRPINIMFVCHMPALWNMFDSIYKAVIEDQGFTATVVALPYRHASLSEGEYKDDGVFEYLSELNVPVIRGYDKTKDVWLNPEILSPDYIFYQTPYRNFPDVWSIEYTSLISRICYVPYGGCIYAGEVDEIVNPKDFFDHARMIFKENQYTKQKFVKRFGKYPSFVNTSVIISGSPKLDFLADDIGNYGSMWRRGLQTNIKRILWTPRWRTTEGNCHFFDYKQFFINFCMSHPNVDFIFRPHPLCLQNFLKTGELSSSELEQFESQYEKSSNMFIDKFGGFEDTFVTSDILVSDMSTILFEYFATGKPIIYTHRVNHFNELGNELSKGLYWATNSTELDNILEMLMSGRDPLKAKRQEIIKSLFFMPDGGAGRFIKEAILKDYLAVTEIT